MTLSTPEHIAELSQAELVALVKELIAAVQRLEAECVFHCILPGASRGTSETTGKSGVKYALT